MFKNSDLIFKIASGLIAVISIGIGLYEYQSSNNREFRSNYFKQQNQTYEQLLEDLGLISASIGDSLKTDDFKKSVTDFEKLYFGKLNLYQNQAVENECDTLYQIINKFKENHNLVYVDSIQSRIYDLAQECKGSLKDTYEIGKE